jgi:hypothetical protein
VGEPDYIAVKNRALEGLLARAGVHAVGVGAKIANGERTQEPAVIVYVEQKKPLDEIAPADLVPSEIDGVKTDVIEMPIPTVLQRPGQLFGANREDTSQYRPVRGGTQIARAGASGVGTLGCLMTVGGDPNTVIALTNHHVIYDEDCSATANHEEAGQPDGSTSSCGCCGDIIGKVLDAQCDADVDIALVKLDGGVKWLGEVQEIGVVTGAHALAAADVAPANTFQVVKRGRTSGFTGGTIQAWDTSGSINKHDGSLHRNYDHVMVITPNPDPASPGTGTDFSLPGDSGSAILDTGGKVVGILFGGSSATATASGSALAFPIQTLVDKFATGVAAARRLTLQVATATTSGDERTVPDPMTADPQPARLGVEHGQRIEEELRTSRQGAWYADLFHRHRVEVGALVHQNRRVTLVWHRSGGAELFQRVVRAFASPDTPVPEEIQGRPLRACIDDVVAALRRHGSAALKHDLEAAMPTLPDLAGLTDREILERLKRAATPALASPA